MGKGEEGSGKGETGLDSPGLPLPPSLFPRPLMRYDTRPEIRRRGRTKKQVKNHRVGYSRVARALIRIDDVVR